MRACWRHRSLPRRGSAISTARATATTPIEGAIMSKPAFLPASAGEAFRHINAVTAPTIDDLKLMVYLEASGEVGYGDLADGAPEAVAKLLNANGREEVAHAHRVAKAIRLLT